MADRIRWLATTRLLAAIATVLAIGGIAAGALVVHDQGQQIEALRAQTAVLTAANAEQDRAAEAAADVHDAALSSTRTRLATLSAELTATSNRLLEAEKELDITAASLPPDVSELAAKVVPSVVFLSCGTATGTGFALDIPATRARLTTIVTAAHVVGDCAGPAPLDPMAPQVAVNTEDGYVIGAVRALDLGADVALVEAEVRVPPLAAATSEPAQGEFVLAIGNPLGMQQLAGSVTQGTISKVVDDTITHTAPVSSGNSGGPLVNRRGEVIAIVSAVIASQPQAGVHTENLNIAVRLRALCNTSLTGDSCKLLH